HVLLRDKLLVVGVVDLHVLEQDWTLGIGRQEFGGSRGRERRKSGVLRRLHLAHIAFIARRQDVQADKRAEELAVGGPDRLRRLCRPAEKLEFNRLLALRSVDIDLRDLCQASPPGRQKGHSSTPGYEKLPNLWSADIWRHPSEVGAALRGIPGRAGVSRATLVDGTYPGRLVSTEVEFFASITAGSHAAHHDVARHLVGTELDRLIHLEDQAAQQDRLAKCQPPVRERPHIFVAM